MGEALHRKLEFYRLAFPHTPLGQEATVNRPTQEEVRERFLRLFVEEHTDGSYYYVTFRNTEESPEPCCAQDCNLPASLRTFDVEDERSGGLPMCAIHWAEMIAMEEGDKEPFYKPTGASAEQAWNGTAAHYPHWHTVTGWSGVWPLFAAPGWPQSEWPELDA